MKNLIKFVVKKLFGQAGIEFCIRLKYSIFNFICALFPMRDEIIFESHPDFTCNTYELYRYMVKQGLQNKYKLTWLVNNPEQYKDRTDVYGDLIEIEPTDFKGWWKKYFRCNRAKVFIGCNRHIDKRITGKKQLNIYLNHGMAIKDASGFMGTGVDFCDYSLVDGQFFIEQRCKIHAILPKQVVVTGAPYTDQFYKKYSSMTKIYDDYYNFDKVIAWVPTFREHKSKTRVDCRTGFPFGIPILYTEQDVMALNQFLVEKNILIIMKPHPAQDLDVIKKFETSNIRFLTDSELIKSDVQTNEFLAQTDAMIGDYSGIYYDYLLADKPIGITLDDFEKYKNQSGFIFDDFFDVVVGEYIYSFDDMKKFVDCVSRGQDNKKVERTRIKNLTHDFDDGKSSQRVYEFILNCMEKKDLL